MRTRLKIAYTEKALELFGKVGTREAVMVDHTDFTDVGAILVTEGDRHTVASPWVKALHIPIFLIVPDGSRGTEKMGEVYSIISLNPLERKLFERQIESALRQYEETILPPFFKGLLEYVEQGNSEFDCPGHQGGCLLPETSGRPYFL